MHYKKLVSVLLGLGFLFVLTYLSTLAAPPEKPTAVTYYVSSSSGDDDNNGLSEGNAFETIGKVNSLDLQPGDQVLFKCGDIWRGEMLEITKLGAAGQPITFTSYPKGCADKPIISGAQAISGWTLHNGNIYKANLNAGANAGKFGYGINQLFRGDERLMMGRWPNIDQPDGGYATVDSASATSLTDNELPTVDWKGAVVHIKSIRWAMLNRRVTSSSGHTLSLGANTSCWGGCAGWGYFLNNHLATLDQDGEWYYDSAAQVVYLYSASGAPSDGVIEGSVITIDADHRWRSWGGITIGEDLNGDHIAYINVENFQVQRWYRHGIAIPTNFTYTEPHYVNIQNNIIRDVDGIGINLATWVWNANDGRNANWRGGYQMTIDGNTIERANQMGINLYSRDSVFSNNTIRDIARIEYLGERGMGCDYDDGGASGGICTEDGDGIRVKISVAADTGNNNTLSGNYLERIGYGGIQVFGFENTLENNVIIEPCYTKGDCGGVSTYSGTSLSSSPVYNTVIRDNIIVDTIGNTDGCRDDFDDLFGFGLYLSDARDSTIDGNTVIRSTVHGLLLMNASGSVTNNTFYDNGLDRTYDGSQTYLGDPPSAISVHTGNILFGLLPTARTLSVAEISNLGPSDNNYFFNPYRSEHIYGLGSMRSLASWQAASGKDGNSKEHWYTQEAGETPLSHIFYNDTAQSTTIDLGNVLYEDLDQNSVSGSITLAPYTSRILIESGEAGNLDVSMALLSSADTVPGEPVTYTITLRNDGILDAEDVTLVNDIPSEIISTSWQANPGTATLVDETRYTWEIASLPVGAAYTFTVSGEYDSGITPGIPLQVTATASTTSPEADPNNNQDSLLLGDWKLVYLPLISR
jgi:uncharacterized repeat protein (TIGR01451 family)